MQTIKSESLNLCLQLIKLRQKCVPAFGNLIVESKKACIDIIEKNSTANYTEDISCMVNACVNLSFYVKYNIDYKISGKNGYVYHIF